jgi:hypothetical protein
VGLSFLSFVWTARQANHILVCLAAREQVATARALESAVLLRKAAAEVEEAGSFLGDDAVE